MSDLAIAAMDWSHRLRDADSGEWFEAVLMLKRLGYDMEETAKDSDEKSFWLRHPELPDIHVIVLDGEVWRVGVERTGAHRAAAPSAPKERSS